MVYEIKHQQHQNNNIIIIVITFVITGENDTEFSLGNANRTQKIKLRTSWLHCLK